MAVVTTDLGSNSAKIVYDAGTALASLISAVDTYITAHGWSLYDGAAGTNKKAYRALNKDGSTYKYVVLDYNTSGKLFVGVYETWDSGTHTGTNAADLSISTSDTNGVYCQQVDLTNGASLYIYSHARWLFFLSKLGPLFGSLYGQAWCGCFETARDMVEDTVALGYPCWGWVNGYLLLVTATKAVSYPRMRDGATGTNASTYNLVSIPFGWAGYTGGSSSNYLAFMDACPNLWANKNWAFTIQVGKNTTSGSQRFGFLCGRIYGLKWTQRHRAGFGNDIYTPCDVDYFYDPTGGSTQHWYLPDPYGGSRCIIPA